MLCTVLGYNDEGEVVETLDHMMRRGVFDEHGAFVPGTEEVVTGFIDFEAHELAGGEMTDVIVMADPVVGAKVWPEWIGPRAFDFRVELEGSAGHKRIAALVHVGRPESRDAEGNVVPAIPASGFRRERAVLEAEVNRRIAEKRAEAEARAAEIRANLPRRDEHGRFRVLPEVHVEPEPADIRDIVGGPGRPLQLDEGGRTVPRTPRQRTMLPIVQVLREHLHDPELIEAIEGGGRAAADDQP